MVNLKEAIESLPKHLKERLRYAISNSISQIIPIPNDSENLLIGVLVNNHASYEILESNGNVSILRKCP